MQSSNKRWGLRLVKGHLSSDNGDGSFCLRNKKHLFKFCHSDLDFCHSKYSEITVIQRSKATKNLVPETKDSSLHSE